MSLRERLTEGTTPHLESGEAIKHIFVCQTGPSPYWSLLTYLMAFSVKVHIFAVTDRSIVILRTGMFAQSKPKHIEKRFPRETRLGPVSGLWGKIELDGEKYWVHKRFHKDVDAADAELGQGQGLAPPA